MKRLLVGLGTNKKGGIDVDEPQRAEQEEIKGIPGCGQCEEPIVDINPHKPGAFVPYYNATDLPGYEDLRRILDLAYKQAALGKGKERHGVKGEAWSSQPIIRHQRSYGIGFALGQAAKKMEEAQHMPPDRAKFELLGAIVYVAAAYRFLEELEGSVQKGE